MPNGACVCLAKKKTASDTCQTAAAPLQGLNDEVMNAATEVAENMEKP